MTMTVQNSAIYFQTADAKIAPHPITPDLARKLEVIGENPRIYNRMQWPLGASQHASGKFLIHGDLLKDVIGEDTTDSVEFWIGDIRFDKVYVRNPRPVMVSEASGVVWEIEVVDERWIWQGNHASGSGFVGYNVSADDRTALYDATEYASDDDYNIYQAVSDIILSLSTETGEWDIPDNADLQRAGEPRDLYCRNSNAAVVLDRLLASAGYVLSAFPSTSYNDDTDGFRYRLIRIEDGQDDVHAILTTYSDDIQAGGIYAPDADFNAESINGAGRKACDGKIGWLNAEVPASVDVCFPVAADADVPIVFNDEDEDETGSHWVVDRYYEVNETTGRPSGVDGSGTGRIYASMWATKDTDGEVSNSSDLSTMAAYLSRRYYARFKAGCGTMLFRSLLPVTPWAGSQVIEWSVQSGGVFTRTDGRADSHLFGHAYERFLRPEDVLTIGGVHAIPRPDGGVLLDARGAAGGRIHVGRVTTVVTGSPAGYNGIYDAEAIDDPSISVTAAVPADRIISSSYINWHNKSVDDTVLLVQDEDGDLQLYANEAGHVVACDSSVDLGDLTDVNWGLGPGPTDGDLFSPVGGVWGAYSPVDLGLVRERMIDTYDSAGGREVTTAAATVPMNTVRVNSDGDLFAHAAGEITVAEADVYLVGGRVSVGLEGDPVDDAFGFMIYLAVNGVEVPGSRAYGGN